MTNPHPLTLHCAGCKDHGPFAPEPQCAGIFVGSTSAQPSTEAVKLADELSRLIERLVGISTPRMEGDNLAILLCSHFDDGGEPEDDTGWSPAATGGYDEVVNAIADHFSPILQALRQSPPLPSIDEARKQALEEAAKAIEEQASSIVAQAGSSTHYALVYAVEVIRDLMRVDAPKGLDDG